jgi:hypothetical protein
MCFILCYQKKMGDIEDLDQGDFDFAEEADD